MISEPVDELGRQVAHWRAATVGLRDLSGFASSAAWAMLERYLGQALRGRLQDAVVVLERQADVLAAELRAATTPTERERLRIHIIEFRRRYERTETALDFFGDAVNTRTNPRIGAILAACDLLAVQSMRVVLDPLQIRVPPVLSYVDKGMGASILRAGLRLWDGTTISPVAAVRIARHNLYRPTALIHETGHQVAHLTGWNEELKALFATRLPQSGGVSESWMGWVSEVSADAFAFAHTGYGAVVALHDVVGGDMARVFLDIPGDPHPVPFIRVLLGLEMCVRFFGAGPWDELRDQWVRTHPISNAPWPLRELLERSIDALPLIVELCLRAPLRAFNRHCLADFVDPRRVSPWALEQLAREAGSSLTRSPYWLRTECIRLLALMALRAATKPADAETLAEQAQDWMVRLGELEMAA